MEIYVRPDLLGDAADKCSSIEQKIAGIESSFNRIVGSLDWQVKVQASVNRYVSHINRQLDTAENTLRKHYTYLSDAQSAYLEAENEYSRNAENLKNALFGSGGSNNSGSLDSDLFKNNGKSIIDRMKLLFEKYLKINGRIMSLFGNILGGFSSNSLFSYYRGKPITASLILSLIADSTNKGLDLLGAYYQNAFKPKNGLNLGKGLEDVFEGSRLGKFFGGEVGFLKKMGIKASGADVAGVVLDVFSEFGKSYYEYSKDGNMSGTDWRDLAIDVTSEGLMGTLQVLSDSVAPGSGFAIGAADEIFNITDRSAEGYKIMFDSKPVDILNAFAYEIGHPKQWIKGFLGIEYSEADVETAVKWQQGDPIEMLKGAYQAINIFNPMYSLNSAIWDVFNK